MKPVRHYRMWIYSINALIIFFQTILGLSLYGNLTHPWWKLIPLTYDAKTLIIMQCQMVIQYFACIIGILGVYFSTRCLIKIYWLLTVPLLLADIFMVVPLVIQLRDVHREFHLHLSTVVDENLQNGMDSCPLWDGIQRAYSCCAPTIIQDKCSPEFEFWANTSMCASSAVVSCGSHILRWMHTRTDVIGIILYFVLFPLKFVVVLVLRDDIQELFSEIVYSDHIKLSSYWPDDDDEDYEDSPPPEVNLFGA